MEIAEAGIGHVNCLTKELRRLYLVEDIVDSIKVRLCNFFLLLLVFQLIYAMLTFLNCVLSVRFLMQ